MKATLTAITLAATLAQPAAAITFPTLTTIYVGTGVRDSGGASHVGLATVFQCSNVSGSTAQVRFLVIEQNLAISGSKTVNLAHGSNVGVATHFSAFFPEEAVIAPGVVIYRGTINIESTESGVFCVAHLTDAAAAMPNVIPLELVRVNPHPGTVE